MVEGLDEEVSGAVCESSWKCLACEREEQPNAASKEDQGDFFFFVRGCCFVWLVDVGCGVEVDA